MFALKQSIADVKPSVVIWIKVSGFFALKGLSHGLRNPCWNPQLQSLPINIKNEWRRETICSFSIAVPLGGFLFFFQKYPAGGLRVWEVVKGNFLPPISSGSHRSSAWRFDRHTAMFCTSSECRVSAQLCLVYLQGNLSFTGPLWINRETHGSFFFFCRDAWAAQTWVQRWGVVGREESRIGFIIEKLWNRRSAMSCILVLFFFLFIVYLYPPPPLLGIYLVLWASWPWGIARSCRKIVGDKYIYNGTHSSMSLTVSQWSDGPETFCGLLCCGKQVLMLGRPADLRGSASVAPSVSLPYKSDHEWKRGWYHDKVQRRTTSEKAFG